MTNTLVFWQGLFALSLYLFATNIEMFAGLGIGLLVLFALISVTRRS